MKYVTARGNTSAKIVFIGEAPGAMEEIKGKAFIGPSGDFLNSLIREMGLRVEDCYFTNVARFKPEKNNIETFVKFIKKPIEGRVQHEGAWVEPFILDHLNELHKELDLINPTVIVPLGNLALWATTGERGITKWRGSVMKSKWGTVIPTFHPANIMRAYANLRLVKKDLTQIKRFAYNEKVIEPDFNFIVSPTFDRATKTLDWLLLQLNEGKYEIACDLETRRGHTACIGLAWSTLDAICIPWIDSRKPDNHYWNLDEEATLTWQCIKLLLHPNLVLLGQNFNYDNQYLEKSWGVTKTSKDTMLRHHVCFPGTEKTLDNLSSIYRDTHYYWKGEGKEWNPKKNKEEALWSYNCKDCVATYEVSLALDDVIKQLGREEPEQFQIWELQPAVLKIMIRGVNRDHALTEEIATELTETANQIMEDIEFLLGHPLNPKSTPQMRALFYEDFQQSIIRDRKTGNPTLDKGAMKRIGEREPLLLPLTRRIEEYRAMTNFRDTFILAPLDDDGRMRTSFNIGGTETFRFSSSTNAFWRGTNLQNTPKASPAVVDYLHDKGNATPAEICEALHMSLDKVVDSLIELAQKGCIDEKTDGSFTYRFHVPNVRKLFIPDEGYVWLKSDLDRADLQVVVWEAEDEDLKQKLKEGIDIHAENAKDIGLEREVAKRFVHLTNYYGQARTCAVACGITVREAELAQKRWFEAHPGIVDWHRRTEDELDQPKPQVSNAFGYVRHYFDRPQGLLPQALAWVPQSTVAIVTNKGLVNIDKNLPAVELLLQIHDELDMQVKVESFPNIVPSIVKELDVVVPYPDPLIIPSGISFSYKSWGELTPMEKYEDERTSE